MTTTLTVHREDKGGAITVCGRPAQWFPLSQLTSGWARVTCAECLAGKA